MAHLSEDELLGRIALAKKRVEIGGQYTHYRHPEYIYTVIAVALDEATQEPVVVYESNREEKLIWVRPLEDWLSSVEVGGGRTVPKFAKQQ